MESSMRNGEDGYFFREHVFPVAANAGDVVLFSEATVHGALAWTNKEQQRLIALYRFAPAICAYARGYLVDNFNNESQLKEMDVTEAEKAVLQLPFDSRFDRNVIDEETGEVKTIQRSSEKKTFDKLVFGKDYF